MAATFLNNDASADQRPSSFCGLTRSSADWYAADNPSSPYNQKWFQYISAMEGYLNGLGYLDLAYYYIANEPQNQAGYDAVAWYSEQLKTAASNLKLAVSEEPKPEIYDNPTVYRRQDRYLAGPSGHPPQSGHRSRTAAEPRRGDLVLLSQRHLSSALQRIHHRPSRNRVQVLRLVPVETSPARPGVLPVQRLELQPLGQPATEQPERAKLPILYPPSEDNSNIAYGANGHRFVPSIRLQLLRDGLEDYEYFYLLSGGQPQPGASNPADPWVDRIIGGAQAFNRDGEMMYNLRRLIGLKISGEISFIPAIEPQSSHPRSDGPPGDYYLNFQDPSGDPTGLVSHDGHTYMKIGNDLYSAANGYGWMRSADVPPANFYQKL